MSGLLYVGMAKVGTSLSCPGCGETVTLDWADGWRNDNGFTCNPDNTTHAQHIFTTVIWEEHRPSSKRGNTLPTEGDDRG